MTRFGQRFLWILLYYGVVLTIGAVGYRHVEEGWSWFDALYMSVITATCVGYEETHPLSPAGRAFTIGLLGLSLLGLGLLWAMTTALFIELDLGGVFRKRRMMKRVDRMSGHYIVCGAGRMGRVIVDEMIRAGAEVVVIESSPDRVMDLRERYPGLPVIEGNATSDATLETVGVDRARGLAASLRDDADNLFLCLTARALGPHLQIAVRARSRRPSRAAPASRRPC
jgi:voltage-gated potassium channel